MERMPNGAQEAMERGGAGGVGNQHRSGEGAGLSANWAVPEVDSALWRRDG